MASIMDDFEEYPMNLNGMRDKMNKENADKGEPCYTLAEMLARKSIDALRAMGKLYGIDGAARMTGPALTGALKKEILREDRFVKTLLSLGDEEWQMFRDVAAVKELPDGKRMSAFYATLLSHGLMCLYAHDGFRYVASEEVRALYRTLEERDFVAEKAHMDLLRTYALAATNLYGVISLEDFIALFNGQNERKTNRDELTRMVPRYPLRISAIDNFGYCFWEDYIVNVAFEKNNFDDVMYYARAAASKPRYNPTREQLLKYGEWCYAEPTPQLAALALFIRTELGEEMIAAAGLAESIALYSRHTAVKQDYRDMLDVCDVHFSTVEQEKIGMIRIRSVRNNVRLWINNGHTANEIMRMMKKEKEGPAS